VSLSRSSDLSLGDRVLATNEAIHTGSILGMPSRIAIWLASALVLVQACSGLLMWLCGDRTLLAASRFMRKAIAVVLLLAMNAMAGDLTGKWSGSFKVDGADHDVPQLLIFKQDGTKLTGSGGPDKSEQYPIENGKVDGDRVGFEITTGEWKFTYSLKASGARMTGSLELKSVNSSRTATVTLSKTE
jgi:hypothetical protein